MEDDLTNNITDCALVFEGGGYRAAYTAAIANALLREGCTSTSSVVSRQGPAMPSTMSRVTSTA